jgi:outer membrane protein OmpA-like peptidoglycan-associated protein/tetratricopeptide (TPR) repeat protein
MDMIIKKILSLVLVLISISISAQNVEFTKDNFPNNKDGLKTALKNIKEGDKLYYSDYKQFNEAKEFYLDAYGFNQRNAMLNFKIGACFFATKDSKDAIEFLEKAKMIDPKVTKELNYLLAIAYQRNYQFDKAISTFTEFRRGLSPDNLKEYEESVEKHIKECNTGKELVAHPVRVFVDALPPEINTRNVEYGPVVNADESVLFFTTRRPENVGGEIDEGIDDYYEDIYIAHKDSNNKWLKAENPGKPLNTRSHDAVAGISADGQQLYIYRGEEGGDIYMSKMDGDEWTKPEKLNKNINSKAHESSAAFSYDYLTIYFVSDREGGYGKHDIYMSKRDEKGHWGEATNLGAKVNTRYEEAAIFAHPDGKTFYFSSKGHNTMGGYDIFKVEYNNGVWTDPVNMGYPINTTGDDIFLSIDASGKHAYYASTQDPIRRSDIYMITFLGAEKPLADAVEDQLLAFRNNGVRDNSVEAAVVVEESQLTILKGTITDEFTGEPLFANIELTDNKTNKIIATFTSNKATGKYLVSLPAGKDYGIAVKAEDCLFYSDHVNIEKSEGFQEIIKDIQLKRIAVGSKVVLNNIFFATGKATLKKESKTELENLLKLLNDAPTLKLEISGHTDNTGSDAVNQKLSERRAKAVVDYLVKNGISADRLTFKGYGSTEPVADNKTKDGRQKNRRTEFKVIAR